MPEKKILVRVDGSHQIGLGHFFRCIALAQMLETDFEITFVSKEFPKELSDQIALKGFRFQAISNDEDFLQILHGGNIVVLDGYQFDTSFQFSILNRGVKLVCIDDLHDKPFLADLIINHAPGIDSSDYQVLPTARLALGPDFVLLRPNFLKQAKEERIIDKVEKAFICFGGSDNKNLTESTLKVVAATKRFNTIFVVTGEGYINHGNLSELLPSYPNAEYHHNIDEDEMLRLMLMSDLAVVPSSGILLEAMSAGCKIISGTYVANQQFIFRAYKETGAIVSAGNFSDDELIEALNQPAIAATKTAKLFDGRSGERLLKLFNQLHREFKFILRPAIESDLEITYQWATNPAVRAFSFNQQPIKPEEHKYWFLKKIKQEDCVFLLMQNEQQSVGSIRFDFEKTNALISFLIDPLFHGMGLGTILLKKGIEFLLKVGQREIQSITGYVMKENRASIGAFENLNFTKIDIDKTKYKFFKALNQNYENR